MIALTSSGDLIKIDSKTGKVYWSLNIVGSVQGSETDFGKRYARGINDSALVQNEDRFIQVVSCNTHNLSSIVMACIAAVPLSFKLFFIVPK